MKDNIKQELIDWQWHNCVPVHQAYRIPQAGVLCADCMLTFVKADRLKRHLTSKCSGQGKAGDIWTNEDESAEIE